MEIEMNIEASNYDNLVILLKDAHENNQLQVEQIRELMNKKVDVLIISPNESDFITPIAVEAYRAGIPTIIVDRKINSDEYTSYVGGDSYQIGKIAGEYASSLLSSGATILEVWG
ncbi:MAG: substrate-binding domain-containing protein, partial [Bacteroidia bacterium]|nr:substrate-binding domain-containing protein [Bacteroidia bacterium]